MNKEIPKDYLINWIDRPPSNSDLDLINYIIGLQQKLDKILTYAKNQCEDYLKEDDCEYCDLRDRITKAIEFLDKVREENGNEIGQVNYETLIEILGGKE